MEQIVIFCFKHLKVKLTANYLCSCSFFEQDTDFEDECKEIAARRKNMTKKLREEKTQQPAALSTVKQDANETPR